MSIEWDLDLSGLDEVTERVREALPFAVARAAEYIRGVSVELAPHREGDLRASAGVTVDTAGDHDTAHVTYDSVYGRYQHYGLDFRHPGGGQALFLEQPMVTEVAAVQKIMSDTIGEAVNG